MTTIIYGEIGKMRRNMNFEGMGTEHLTGKNDGIWLLWGIFKEYIKQNIITAVLRKAMLIQLSFADVNVNKNRFKRKNWFKLLCL